MYLNVLWHKNASVVKRVGLLPLPCLSRSFCGGQYVLLPKVNDGKPNKNVRCLQPNRQFWFGKNNFYEKDNMTKDYSLVYQGPARGYIEVARIGTLSCPVSLTFFGISYFLDFPLDINILQPYVQSTTDGFIGLGMYVALCLAVGTVVNRFVLRIYFKESSNDFVAVLPAWGLKTTRLITFKAGEATIVKDKNTFLILPLLGHIRLKSQRVLIFEDHFQLPIYYNIMLGYNKQDDDENGPSEGSKSKS